jgi:uncharacterized protein
MINIRFKRKEDRLICYTVEGHAEYYENGETIYDDVVCGVVSNLAQVVILGITEILHFSVEYTAEEGYIYLDLCKLGIKELEDCQVLMQTMLLSLENLEISYGNYINVLVEEVQ